MVTLSPDSARSGSAIFEAVTGASSRSALAAVATARLEPTVWPPVPAPGD
jgi:hypothetical protein